MYIPQEINRIKSLMLIKEEQSNSSNLSKNNIFNKFDLTPFKNQPPPADNSEKTKNELKYLATINLNKRFVQKKDDIAGNFMEFLNDKKLKYNKEKLMKINDDVSIVVLELKNYFKRPRPFRLNNKFKDPILKSMEGFAYPSGHSTHSNLICLILSSYFPEYKDDFINITKDIVYSRQMAKAHYPSDITMGKKLAKSMFDYLKEKGVV